jgi:hypothetical protein
MNSHIKASDILFFLRTQQKMFMFPETSCVNLIWLDVHAKYVFFLHFDMCM